MKHPLYTALGALLCLYLATANQRGWSLLSQISPSHWITSGRGIHK
ncbi:MAG: hypothetical protein QOE70_1379 [Chthoniobacter sp.]|jgi:hypothetical protein|nr:hypothetical protein [Chthoniobacter sp.]